MLFNFIFDKMNCEGCEVTLISIAEQVGITTEQLILFLQHHGVLLKEKLCPHCGSECRSVPSQMVFRCNRSTVIDGIKKRCSYKFYMKSNSWLRRSNLSVKKVCHFVCIWLLLPHPRHELFVSELEMSAQTVVEWSHFCREICIKSFLTIDDEVIGGEGKTVEIDEAKFRRQKYCKGKEVDASWIFGFLDRDTKSCLLVPVQDRSAATLINVILRQIAAGTTIISDRWKGYDPLIHHPQYHYLIDSHRLKFVDPLSSTDTQSVEKWHEVHSNIPRFGKGKNLVDGYLAEYYWKFKYERKSLVHNFFLEVARQFNPKNS